MEKLEFETDEGISEFYVIEQTRINETDYLLVSESDDEDAEVLILKDVSERSGDEKVTGGEASENETLESVYELVEDETEQNAVLKVFEELLGDTDE